MRGMTRLSSLAVFVLLAGCPPTETPTPPPDPAPSLAAVDPGAGLTTGGEAVTLSGANLDKVVAVAFGTAAGNITSKSATEIVVNTPAASRGTVAVRATAPAGVAELPNAFRFEVGVNITEVAPASIQANQGATITISGDGFFVADTNPTVRLDSTVLTVTSATNTSIVAAVPSLPEGSYDISVTNTDNRSATATGALQVLAPIVVGSVTPNWGYADRTTDVIIRGSGFDATTAVVFGTLSATTFTVRDSSTIAATAPASGVAGAVAVIVRRGIGDEGQLASGFTYYANDGTLRVLEARPGFGRSTGGQTVVVWGTGFSSAVRIYFGVDEATVTNTASDGLSVTVQTPAHTLSGQLVEEPVNLRANLGTDATLANGFTYYRMPEITQVNPTTLATAGGDTVTIDGAGYMATGMQVLFDNIAATNVTIVNSSQLTCVGPAHAEGVGLPVKVINKYNDEATWSTPGVNFVELTRIQSVTPSSISKAGRTFMTLVGTGLAPTAAQMTVTLDGQPVLGLTRVDQNTLTFHAPGPFSDSPAQKALYIRNNDSGGEHTSNVTIIDPTDKDQLHGGGAINHNINVTVIREDRGERLQGALVFAGNKAAVVDAYDKGTTDINGMTVISGAATATGPVMLTIGAGTYETQTLIGLNAQNVTVLLTPKVPNPPAESYGVISGGITGWANAGLPQVQAGQEKRYYRVAGVFVSDASPLPQDANQGPGVEAWTIEIRTAENQTACPLVLFGNIPATLSDATFSVNSRPGTHALLAIVYYWDSYDGICGNNPLWGSPECTQANDGHCEGWTSDLNGDLLLGAVFGIRDNVAVPVGGGNISNMNINLNHGVANYSANFNNNPTVFGANLTAYTADAYLTVAQSGTFTFLAPKVKGDPMGQSFGPVPALVAGWSYTVHGYVGAPVLDAYGNIYDFQLPVSHSFQRNLTNMTPPTLTNWIYFISDLAYTKPADSEGRFSFTRTGGANVNDNGFTAIGIYHVAADSTVTPLWTVMAAGDQQTITLPDVTGESILAIPQGEHRYSALQATVPNFDFNTLQADDRTALNWSASVQSVPMALSR